MIPQETIDQIKRDADIIEVIQSRGIKLTQNGKEYKGLCPFHEDTKPSFSVNPIMKLWYCFACDTGGDVIKFVQMYDKLSFDESVNLLSNNGQDNQIKKQKVNIKNLARSKILSRVFEFYQKTFLEDKRGLEYLVCRGIESADVFKTIKPGFANGSLINTLSDDLKSQLKKIGILTRTGRELFYECVVFPLVDPNGQITNLYGRHISKNQHLFLPRKREGLLFPSKGTDSVIITEGIIDALTLMNAGWWNVLAIYGVNGLTDDHLFFLQQQRIKEVFLCLDGDDTGRKAVPILSEKIKQTGCDVFSVQLPEGLDINDYFRTHSRNDFEKLVEPSQKQKETKSISGHAPKEQAISGGFVFDFGGHSYRVLGMNLYGLDRMRVNLKVTEGNLFHIDTLDLYISRAREAFVKTSSKLLNTEEEILNRELITLIDLLEEKRLQQLKTDSEPEKETMNDAERKEALKFLKSKNILKDILRDFDSCGLIGEETTKLFGYLATVSRFLEKPLGILIVSRSGAGKSILQDTICDFVPPEDTQRYTRITGQSLFYKQSEELKYKVLSIAEEKGAEDAIYSIRTLQSDQHLTVAVTITDPKTGHKRTEEYLVEGPVVIIITTTNPEALDFETRNRFVILTIDESRQQTKRILERQRQTESLEGLVRSKNKDHILRKHHNAQRLLKKIHVVNPFHGQLTYPDNQLLMRRDHPRYLTLINTIAFLHQYQREIKTVKTETGEILEYIEVTAEDIRLANRLASEVMGRSLDELSPHTRSLLVEIKKMVDELCKNEKKKPEEIWFTRRDIRNYTGWSYWQVQDHLQQLLVMEYLVVHKGGKDNLYRYELVWDGKGQSGEKFLVGLIDVKHLKKA